MRATQHTPDLRSAHTPRASRRGRTGEGPTLPSECLLSRAARRARGGALWHECADVWTQTHEEKSREKPRCPRRALSPSVGTRPISPSVGGGRQRASDGPLCEEVVALVVDDDEGGEVLDLDLPDRLHAQLGVLEHLDLGGAASAPPVRGGASGGGARAAPSAGHAALCQGARGAGRAFLIESCARIAAGPPIEPR